MNSKTEARKTRSFTVYVMRRVWQHGVVKEEYGTTEINAATVDEVETEALANAYEVELGDEIERQEWSVDGVDLVDEFFIAGNCCFEAGVHRGLLMTGHGSEFPSACYRQMLPGARLFF